MIWTQRVRRYEWRRWFAWRPVRLANYTCGSGFYQEWAWFEWVERRSDFYPFFKYRRIADV